MADEEVSEEVLREWKEAVKLGNFPQVQRFLRDSIIDVDIRDDREFTYHMFRPQVEFDLNSLGKAAAF